MASLSTLKNDLDILNEWTLEDFKGNLKLADLFVENLGRYLAGESLRNIVDMKALGFE